MNLEKFRSREIDVGEVSQEMVDYSHTLKRRYDERFCDTPITVETRIFFIELKKKGATYKSLAEDIGKVSSSTIDHAIGGNAGKFIRPELGNVSATRYVYDRLKELAPDLAVIDSEIIQKRMKISPGENNTKAYEEIISRRSWSYKEQRDSSMASEIRALLIKEKKLGNNQLMLAKETGISSSIISRAVNGSAGFASTCIFESELIKRAEERHDSANCSGTGRCNLG